MKKFSFKELVQFKEDFTKILEFLGYAIYDTDHSVARYNERIGKKLFLYEKLLKKGIKYLVDNNLTQKENKYIWYSEKYGFGIQVHWRTGRENDIFGGYSATTLSDDEMKYFKYNDKKIFLESLWKEGYSKEYSMEVVERGYMRYGFKENLELKQELYDNMIDLYVQSGKVYYTFKLLEL